ncbi:MAG: hypothetical protein HY360_17265 [Verrucomicrobia bacterium]|nr:hypothetical protein [Verrucomicrobiota bacterium]
MNAAISTEIVRPGAEPGLENQPVFRQSKTHEGPSVPSGLRVGLIGFSEPYWNRDYVSRTWGEAKSLLSRLTALREIELRGPNQPLMSPADVAPALDAVQPGELDGLIVHCASFAAGEIPLILAQCALRYSLPVVLWATPETEPGHIKANTFTSLHMFSALLHRQGVHYKSVYGYPDGDSGIGSRLDQTLRAWQVIHGLRGARIANIGGRSPGFYLCNYDELALRRRFGIIVEPMEVRELLRAAERVSDDMVQAEKRIRLKHAMIRCAAASTVDKGIRAYLAARQWSREGGYAGIALRCWPEFLEQYHAAACLAVGLLNEDGIITSDEGDVGGLISMLAQRFATGERETPTLLDLIGFDEKENTCWLWHCGATAPCLGQPGRRCEIFDSPILSPEAGGAIGPAISLGIRPGPVTILRFGGPDCGRIFACEGKILDRPVRFHGAYAEVQLPKENPVAQPVAESLSGGWEYHLSLCHRHHAGVLREVAAWLGLPCYCPDPEGKPAGGFSCFSQFPK